MAAAISSAVRLLGNLLIKKVEFLGEVSGQVQLLISELNRMQSFLKDANNKKAQDERVRTWIMDIREVAHDAVDAIETYVHNVDSNKVSKGAVGSITSFPKNTYYRNKVGNKIKWIRARLDDIDKSRLRYGIKDLGEASESLLQLQVEQLRRLAPEQKGEQLVGMDDDVKKVLQEFVLDDKRKELGIGVLQGIGGIGKSTLAREIYNHPAVRKADRFECRAWVVVSSQFTPQETIKQLIFELQKSEEEKKQTVEEFKRLEDTMKDRQYLQRKLKEMLHKQLKGKSYFIVLDDLWEKEHLEYFITAFPNQQEHFLWQSSLEARPAELIWQSSLEARPAELPWQSSLEAYPAESLMAELMWRSATRALHVSSYSSVFRFYFLRRAHSLAYSIRA